MILVERSYGHIPSSVTPYDLHPHCSSLHLGNALDRRPSFLSICIGFPGFASRRKSQDEYVGLRCQLHATQRGSGGGPDDGEYTTLDALTDHFGSVKWDVVIEVTSPEGERFRHAGRYKISNRLGGIRRSLKRWRPLPGLAVPVLVSSDRTEVDIDWDVFVSRGGIEHAVVLTDQRRTEQATSETGKMLAKNPKKAAKQRELALAHGPDMALQVTTGVRPAHEFSLYITGLVQGGALSEDEGDALLRQAGLL